MKDVYCSFTTLHSGHCKMYELKCNTNGLDAIGPKHWIDCDCLSLYIPGTQWMWLPTVPLHKLQKWYQKTVTSNFCQCMQLVAIYQTNQCNTMVKMCKCSTEIENKKILAVSTPSFGLNRTYWQMYKPQWKQLLILTVLGPKPRLVTRLVGSAKYRIWMRMKIQKYTNTLYASPWINHTKWMLADKHLEVQHTHTVNIYLEMQHIWHIYK